MPSKTETREKVVKNTSKKAAKLILGEILEDTSQFSQIYNNEQKDKKKNSRMKRKKKRKLSVSPNSWNRRRISIMC